MILRTEADTTKVGQALGMVLRVGDVVTLSGPLGAGKTTLVRGVLDVLGHQGDVPSPSFAIVQPYDDLAPPLWHVDLYRIEDPSDLEELGLNDALIDGCLIVEWPNRAGNGAWPEALALSLTIAEDGSRALTAEVPTAWEGRWPVR